MNNQLLHYLDKTYNLLHWAAWSCYIVGQVLSNHFLLDLSIAFVLLSVVILLFLTKDKNSVDRLAAKILLILIILLGFITGIREIILLSSLITYILSLTTAWIFTTTEEKRNS